MGIRVGAATVVALMLSFCSAAMASPVATTDAQYDVDKAAFKATGGRVAGSSVDAGARNAQAVYSRVTLGELRLGQGDIRIAGALLPQPSEEFDHTLGLEPYAVTYTGYIVTRNLLAR